MFQGINTVFYMSHKQNIDYINQHQERFLEELKAWLRIPSISTDDKFKPALKEASEFIKCKLEEVGMDTVKIYPTKRHPIVYAEKINKPNAPTVLVYGHYDVQPVDERDSWVSPPFEPEIRDKKIYARGVCDDKGQAYMHIKALEVLKDVDLKHNIKVLLEGEEEIGSPNLEHFIEEHQYMLKADYALISDTAMISNDIPSICVGLRGIFYSELSVYGPNRDIHSGVYGGAVANPINILCELLGKIKDETGKINIPDFYNDIQELPENVKQSLQKVPFNEAEYKAYLGIKELKGEKGYTPVQQTSIRPSLDINGIWGGYMGQGSKTIIPSSAHAKVSMRLVPNQNPETVKAQFTKYLEENLPSSVRFDLKVFHGGEPIFIPTDSEAYLAAEEAYSLAFGKKPLATCMGGSIPVVAVFKQLLGIDSIMMGFGLDTDNIHSHNEHFGVYNFLKGIETVSAFHQIFSSKI